MGERGYQYGYRVNSRGQDYGHQEKREGTVTKVRNIIETLIS